MAKSKGTAAMEKIAAKRKERGADAAKIKSVAATPARSYRPHVCLYIGPAVQDAVKQIALEQRRRPHDVLVDGLRMILHKHGVNYDALTEMA